MVTTVQSKHKKENFYNYITKNRILNSQNNQVLVKMSIDLLRISISKFHFNKEEFFNLFNVIARFSSSIEKYIDHDKVYSDGKDYEINYLGEEHLVIARNAPCVEYLPMQITIHEPTRQLLNYLTPYLNKMIHNISQVEFTLDCISDEPHKVFQFFKQHLLLSNPGRKSFNLNYDTSFYRNDIRGARGKGLKCYWKTITFGKSNLVQSIRVELTMKRQLMKSKGIDSINDFLSMNNNIPVKYLLFRKFNYGKFHSKLVEQGYGSEFITNLLTDIKSDVNNGFLYESNVTAKTYYKKGSLTYLDNHGFHEHFRNSISGKNFLNGDIFSVDMDRMVCC